MPLNAETYTHRCGRTARIGKSGMSFSLLGPEDEKAFRLIYKTLGKGKLYEDERGDEHRIGDIEQYRVDYSQLAHMKKFIDKIVKVEQALHKKVRTEKNLDWVVNLASETGIDIPEEMKREMEGLEEKEKAKLNKQKKRDKKRVDKVKGNHKMVSLEQVGPKSSYLNPD